MMLLLVRHGETLSNRQGLLLGRADPPLTDVGEAQARHVASTLPVPDRVISSPLRRALDTAAAFGSPVEIDERWIELDYGELDGRHPTPSPTSSWARWRADASFAPPGGESLSALVEPSRCGCAELARGGRRVDGAWWSPTSARSRRRWRGRSERPIGIAWRMYVEDASVSRIDFGPDGTGRALVQPRRVRSRLRALEEGVGRVAPRRQRRSASSRGDGERFAPVVVGGEAAQDAAQAGDVAGLDEAAFACRPSIRLGRLPDRQPTVGSPARSASANTVPYVSA